MTLYKQDVTPDTLKQELDILVDRMDIKALDDSLYFPQFIIVETMRFCNARCPFCAIDKWDKSVPLMSDELFDKIATEMGQYKDWIRMIDIQRAGEPLMDAKLADRVKRLKDEGIRFVTTSTNASLLNERRGRALLEAGIDEVMISIDSVVKETYERLRVGLNFERVLDNIKGFFKLRDEINPNTVIRIRGVACFDVHSDEGQRELNEWERFFDPLKGPQDRVYMKQLHTWGNTHVWDDKNQDYDMEWDFAPCIIPWSTLQVTAMGIVPLCGQDMDAKMNLGDANTQTLTEIWRGEKFQKVREMHTKGDRNDISFCQGCKVFDVDFGIERTKGRKKGYFHVPAGSQAAE